jgi:CYTH domain-containing protein
MELEDKRYTRVEYERRFLVLSDAKWRDSVEPYYKTFEDKYIQGTRLRLRILKDSDTGRQIIKLSQKVESESPYYRTVGRLLLSPSEYVLFDCLPGDRLTKTRYYHNYLGREFAVDVFHGELDGLVLCETETDALEDLMSAEPPPFAGPEVTADSFFTGGNLSRTTREELLQKLASLER